MSFGKFQESKEAESSEIDNYLRTLNSSFGQRNLGTSLHPKQGQSSNFKISDKMDYEPDICFPISPSTSKPIAPTVQELKLDNKEPKEIRSIGGSLLDKTISPHHSYAIPHNLNISNPENKEGVLMQPASATKKETGEGPSIDATPRSKDSSRTTFELPLTKQKIAQSFSMDEACGFLPVLMKNKRMDLKIRENQLDQVSVELQKVLMDAKNICIKMENTSETVPRDLSALVVQAEKFMYLLSSSFRIFEKLAQCGSALQDGLKVYSKESEDSHVSVDILLEYIMENIAEKCRQTEKLLTV